MVKNCILFLLLLVTVRSIGQNNYLDDIQLMDNYRTKQLLGNTKDSNLVKDLSFMIRSTFGFQHLYYNSENKEKKLIIKSFTFTDNRLNNSALPISVNDGSLIPAVGLQERTSIGIQLQYRALDINIEPQYLRAENLPQEVFKGNTLDRNWWTRYY